MNIQAHFYSPMSLAERIREARKAKGWTQHRFAKIFGIARAVVSQWETGETIPEMAKIQRLASVLERDAAWLIGGIEPPRRP